MALCIHTLHGEGLVEGHALLVLGDHHVHGLAALLALLVLCVLYMVKVRLILHRRSTLNRTYTCLDEAEAR
jgi:hypothetical protein